jgi:non-specific protein-tyrosine kinase
MADLKTGWSMLRRWLWLLLLGTLLSAAIGFGVSRTLTPMYQATVTMLVNQAQETTGLTSYNDIQTSERLARTYAELIKKRPVVEQVIADLHLPTTYERLVKQIDVRQVRDTQLITVVVEDASPQSAADIANALATTFMTRLAEEQAGQTTPTKRVMARQIADLEGQIKATSEAIEGARDPSGAASGRIAVLQSELSQQQAAYAQMLRSQHELAVAESKAASAVRLAEPAVVPDRPVRPNVLQRTLIAAVVGTALCAGLAFLLEYLDDVARTPELVERAAGLHTLGALTLLRAGAGRTRWGRRSRASTPARVLVAHEAHSPHAEAFRILRTNVEFAQVDRPCRTLVVTSANPCEGKSTVAVNLAVAMAQAGKRVLLVDADLRRPAVHQTLGLGNEAGLTNLLVQGGEPIDLVQATSLPGFLLVLTSGPIPPNPAELLGSARMAELLVRLADMVDHVILDTPPVLAVADPVVLAGRTDGAILVVDANHTSTHALKRAREALDRAGTNILGVALNKLSGQSSGYYYYRHDETPPERVEPAFPQLGRSRPSAATS